MPPKELNLKQVEAISAPGLHRVAPQLYLSIKPLPPLGAHVGPPRDRICPSTTPSCFATSMAGASAADWRVPIPQGARSYSNVSLHIARSSCGLGKGKMRDSGKVRIPRLLVELERQLSPDRKVMLCAHKNVEPIALTCQPNFAAYSVAHWGAIGGKNDWLTTIPQSFLACPIEIRSG